jgi:hypothetical protein
MIGSANRDPERWPDADRFDVARDTTGHLGFGIHFCLGSHLARLESRCALEAVVGRLSNLRFAGQVVRNVNPSARASGAGHVEGVVTEGRKVEIQAARRELTGVAVVARLGEEVLQSDGAP